MERQVKRTPRFWTCAKFCIQVLVISQTLQGTLFAFDYTEAPDGTYVGGETYTMAPDGTEPPRLFRRPFRVSQAALA